MPQSPYRFAAFTLFLGVVYAVSAWYQLMAQDEEFWSTLFYGILIGGLGSLSVLVMVVLGRKTMGVGSHSSDSLIGIRR